MASPDVTAPVRNLAGYAQRHANPEHAGKVNVGDHWKITVPSHKRGAQTNSDPYIPEKNDADRGPLQRSCCDLQRNSTDQAPDVAQGHARFWRGPAALWPHEEKAAGLPQTTRQPCATDSAGN